MYNPNSNDGCDEGGLEEQERGISQETQNLDARMQEIPTILFLEPFLADPKDQMTCTHAQYSPSPSCASWNI